MLICGGSRPFPTHLCLGILADYIAQSELRSMQGQSGHADPFCIFAVLMQQGFNAHSITGLVSSTRASRVFTPGPSFDNVRRGEGNALIN